MDYRKTEYIFNVPDVNSANNYITNYLNNKKFRLYGNSTATIEGQIRELPIYKHQSVVEAGFIEYTFVGNRVYVYAYANSPKHPVPLDGGLQGALAAVSFRAEIDDFIKYLDNLSKNPYQQQYAPQQPVYGQQPIYEQQQVSQPVYQQNNQNQTQPIYNQQVFSQRPVYEQQAAPQQQMNYQYGNQYQQGYAQQSFQQAPQQSYQQPYQGTPQQSYQSGYQNRAVPQNQVPVSQNYEMMTIVSFIGSIISLILSFLGKQIGLLFIAMFYVFAIKGLKNGKNKGMNIATIVILSVSLLISLILIIVYLSKR